MVGLYVVNRIQPELSLSPVVRVMVKMLRVGCGTMIVRMDDDACKGSDRCRRAHAKNWPNGEEQHHRPQ